MFLRLIFLVIFSTFLPACINSQSFGKIEHGFYVENKGNELIRGVVISYGSIQLPFCEIRCLPKRGGGGWNASMTVEDEMKVTWQTADNQMHEARVPVRSKIKDLRRLRTLYLEFNNEHLTVEQGLEYSNPTLVGRELFPLYP